MRDRLLRFYWWLRGRIAPGVRYSQYAYEEALTPHVKPHVDWLDIGCGRALLPGWRAAQEQQLVAGCRSIAGLDYDLDSLRTNRSLRHRVRGDVVTLPFRDDAFDLVTANMVVEHLASPREQFLEVARVLRPRGVFLFHTPNTAGYGVQLGRLVPEGAKGKLIYWLQGRKEEDVFPTHYRANRERDIVELANGCGFDASVELVVSDAIFGMVPPVAFVELLWLRLLLTSRLRRLRPNIVAVLRRRAD